MPPLAALSRESFASLLCQPSRWGLPLELGQSAHKINAPAIVADIASGAQEQASGLERVNGAINQMDQSTQSYAAMASQTSAATRRLNEASGDLAEHIAQFRLDRSDDDYAEAA